ncbi:MAG: hypothetical protein K8R92_11205 [Planctomycetes bacterium]|nr:hypothetical protein [Planctomycetota bacterium]
MICGCAQEKIEYRYRPQFEVDATGRAADETFVKPDGTRVIYTSKRPERKDAAAKTPGSAPEAETPQIELRERKANGDVVLRAMFPEQVVAHVSECVRNEEYELLWNQLLSEEAKRDLADRGGLEYFKTFFTVNRKEVMATLNCMQINLRNGHAIVRNRDATHLSAELDSTLRGSYKFTAMEFESTPSGMKLVSIR